MEKLILKTMNLKELIEKANQNFEVIWHFNVSDVSMLNAVFNCAKNLGKPVIVGVSEGERNFWGLVKIVSLVKTLRQYYNFPIFLNADHCRSFKSAQEAIDVGFDAVIFDGAQLSLNENIKITKQVVEYAKNKNEDIVIEGELGYIGIHSEVVSNLPEGIVLSRDYFTKPEEAEFFVKETGVDLFAPAVGNVHGIILKDGQILNSRLDMDLIKEIKQKIDWPLVLHGGSGILDEELKKAVESGINIIHISTELRLAWRKGIEEFLLANQSEIAPYKILEESSKKVYQIIEKYLNLK